MTRDAFIQALVHQAKASGLCPTPEHEQQLFRDLEAEFRWGGWEVTWLVRWFLCGWLGLWSLKAAVVGRSRVFSGDVTQVGGRSRLQGMYFVSCAVFKDPCSSRLTSCQVRHTLPLFTCHCRSLDANNDGVLSLEEFRAALGIRVPSERGAAVAPEPSGSQPYGLNTTSAAGTSGHAMAGACDGGAVTAVTTVTAVTKVEASKMVQALVSRASSVTASVTASRVRGGRL